MNASPFEHKELVQAGSVVISTAAKNPFGKSLPELRKAFRYEETDLFGEISVQNPVPVRVQTDIHRSVLGRHLVAR